MIENLVKITGIVVRFPLFVLGAVFMIAVYIPMVRLGVLAVWVIEMCILRLQYIPKFFAAAWRNDSKILNNHKTAIHRHRYSITSEDIFNIDELEDIYKWWKTGSFEDK